MSFAYLDRARSTDFFATLKATMLHALAPRAGTRVADLGCGTGDDTAAAAAIGAFAIGLDLSEPHIAEAHRRHRSTGVAFLVADGHHLPLAADRLDGCLVERTLQHVAEPQTVVAEIARVLRRGGRLVVSEPDWASTTVVGGDVAVGNAIVQWWIDGHHRHPRLGQELVGCLVAADFDVLAVRSQSAVYRDLDEADRAFPLRRAAAEAGADGIVPPPDAEAWLAALTAANNEGQFCFAVPMFTAVACRR